MMFVSASKPPAGSTVGSSSDANAPVVAPVPTSAHRDPSNSTSSSHGSHRAGLGYSSAAASSTTAASGGASDDASAAVAASSVTTEDVFVRDYGLGVSLMALQAQRAAQILAHATQYFARSYWLFLDGQSDSAPETAVAPSTIRSKRAQRVRETCRRALWQRSEAMLRKLARVAHPMVRRRDCALLVRCLN